MSNSNLKILENMWNSIFICNCCGCRYPINDKLNEVDMSTLMMALYFHPQRDAKIGSGAKDIQASQIEKSKTKLALCF